MVVEQQPSSNNLAGGGQIGIGEDDGIQVDLVREGVPLRHGCRPGEAVTFSGSTILLLMRCGRLGLTVPRMNCRTISEAVVRCCFAKMNKSALSSFG